MLCPAAGKFMGSSDHLTALVHFDRISRIAIECQPAAVHHQAAIANLFDLIETVADEQDRFAGCAKVS